MTPASKCPLLKELANACNNGACNSVAIIRYLSDATKELQPFEVKNHPAVKIVLGQLSFLADESIGPSSEAMKEWDKWNQT
jgi:hypothetical protein